MVAFHMPDTSHPVNGNMLLALKHAGLWEHVLLNKVVYKSLFGPFGSEAWAQQVRESATMLAKVSHVHDPYVVHFLPDLLRDMGESPDRACDEAFVQSVHDRLFCKEMVEEVGPHLQFTRWGSVVDVGKWWDSRWHSRLLCMIFIGLHMGWLRRADLSGPIGLRNHSADSLGADAKGPTQRAPNSHQDIVAPLRQTTHNVMHIATIVMSSTRQQIIQRLICVVLGPARQWHGWQTSFLRSQSACREFYVAMAGGSWMQHLNHTWALLSQPRELHDAGLQVAFTPAHMSLTPDHVHVVESDEHCQAMLKLMIQLVRFRLRSLLQYSTLYPLKFAAFLDDEGKATALDEFRQDAAAFEYARACDLPMSRKLYDRSCMQRPVNRVMLNYGMRSRFAAVTPAMGKFADQMFNPCIGQERIVEDWFQRGRQFESKTTK